MKIVDDFIEYLRESAAQLESYGASPSEFADSETGVKYQGYLIDYVDFPKVEDYNPSYRPIRRPPVDRSDLYYWGGQWGFREIFLTRDGRLLQHEFRGEDALEGIDIKTTLKYSVSEVKIRNLVGDKKPFADIRGKIDRKLVEAYVDSL